MPTFEELLAGVPSIDVSPMTPPFLPSTDSGFGDTQTLIDTLKEQLGDTRKRREKAANTLYTSPQDIARQKYKDMWNFGSTTDETTGGRRKKSKVEQAKTILDIIGAVGGAVSPNPKDGAYDRLFARETENYNAVAPNVRADINDMRIREHQLTQEQRMVEAGQQRQRQAEAQNFLKSRAQDIQSGKLNQASALKIMGLIIQGKKADAEAEYKRAMGNQANARAGLLGQQTKDLESRGGALGEMGSAASLYEMDPAKRRGAQDIFKGMQTAKGSGRAASAQPRLIQQRARVQDPNTLEWKDVIIPHWVSVPGAGGAASAGGETPQSSFKGMLGVPDGMRTGGPKEQDQDSAFVSAQGSVREAAHALSDAVRSGNVDSMIGPAGTIKYEFLKRLPAFGDLQPQDFTNSQMLRTAIGNALFKHANAQGVRQAGLIEGMKKYFPDSSSDAVAIAGGLASYFALMDISRALAANKNLVSTASDAALDLIGKHYAEQAYNIANGGAFTPVPPSEIVRILKTVSPNKITMEDIKKGAADAAAKGKANSAPASKQQLRDFIGVK